MGSDDVKRIFQPIHDATIAGFCTARHEQKKALENALVAYRPDALDASDLIDAIAAGLKLRYQDCTEVLLRMTLLKGDLERLDANVQIDAEDILAAYERATERRRP